MSTKKRQKPTLEAAHSQMREFLKYFIASHLNNPNATYERKAQMWDAKVKEAYECMERYRETR